MPHRIVCRQACCQAAVAGDDLLAAAAALLVVPGAEVVGPAHLDSDLKPVLET